MLQNEIHSMAPVLVAVTAAANGLAISSVLSIMEKMTASGVFSDSGRLRLRGKEINSFSLEDR